MMCMDINQPTRDQEVHLQAWRAVSLQMMPYMAPIVFAFRPVSTSAVDTFAVDEQLRLYVNFENTIHRGAQFNAEALLHEASHVLAGHAELSRVAGVQEHERTDWNIAADFAINDDLRDAGCKELARHGVFASSIGMADYQDPLTYMEAIRRIRKQQQQQQQQQSGGASQGGQQQGQQQQPPSGDSQGSQQQGQEQDEAGERADSNAPYKGCGTASGGAPGGFEIGANDDLGGFAIPASAVEIELSRINAAASIRDHQKKHGRGSVPAGLRQLIDEVLTPTRTPWQNILRSHMSRAVGKTRGNRYLDSRRRDRRKYGARLLNPSTGESRTMIIHGRTNPQPRIFFYRDTSGSVRHEGLKAASEEVLTIASRLGVRGDNLIVADVDTEVYEAKKFSRASQLAEVTGRGGTSMISAIRHASQGPRRSWPSCIVIATDAGTPWPKHPSPVPVIALLIEAPASAIEAIPDWIIKVEVDAP